MPDLTSKKKLEKEGYIVTDDSISLKNPRDAIKENSHVVFAAMRECLKNEQDQKDRPQNKTK